MSDPAPGRFEQPVESLSLRAGPVPHCGTGAGLAGFSLALAVASVSLWAFYSRGLTNLYGDGIAHMEGARRIFDSLTPGYPEIGTVWLPLFHLLAAPLAQNDFLWRTGLAGSLVSAAAFVVSAWFLFRLAFEMNRNLAAAAVALSAFIAAPNWAYVASTPLTEPLAVLWAVLTVYGLFRFRQTGRRRALLGASFAAFLGTLTRYDGWYLLPFAALFLVTAVEGSKRERARHAASFCAIAGAGPVLWILHNAFRFGNALEFYNGPHSAKAIYAHQLATTGFRYPTDGSLLLSARYYLADMTLVIGACPLGLAVLGLVAWLLERRERKRRSAALLFFVPFVFYVHSLAYASVALYVPTLPPGTYYNLRYGVEMMPAVAILLSFLVPVASSRRARLALVACLLAAVFVQAVWVLARGVNNLPVVKESVLNTPCQSKRQQAIIRFLRSPATDGAGRSQYDGGTLLTAAGQWPCVMPEMAISFRRTLSETNRIIWKGLPSRVPDYIEWILRGDGDAVDEVMRSYPEAFAAFQVVEGDQFPGEGGVRIYRRSGKPRR